MAGKNGQPAFVLLILVTAFVYLTALVFNTLAADPSISRGLFINGIGNVSGQFPLQITPAGWTFSIWTVIYFLQDVWIAYSVVNTCRRVNGAPAYLTPEILTPAFFVLFLFNSLLNISWLFLFDRKHIVVCFPVLMFQTFTCWLGLSDAYTRLAIEREDMVDNGQQKEVNFIRVFVFNGLAMYGTWTSIALTINLGQVLAYSIKPPLELSVTSILCLGIIGVACVGFIIIDLTVMDKYSRFTYTPYLVVIWALAGIISKNWDPEQTFSIMVAVLMGLAVVGMILKVVVTFWRQRQQPVSYEKVKVWATLGNEVYPNLSVK